MINCMEYKFRRNSYQSTNVIGKIYISALALALFID